MIPSNRAHSGRTGQVVGLAGNFFFADPAEPERSHGTRPGACGCIKWPAVQLFTEWRCFVFFFSNPFCSSKKNEANTFGVWPLGKVALPYTQEAVTSAPVTSE